MLATTQLTLTKSFFIAAYRGTSLCLSSLLPGLAARPGARNCSDRSRARALRSWAAGYLALPRTRRRRPLRAAGTRRRHHRGLPQSSCCEHSFVSVIDLSLQNERELSGWHAARQNQCSEINMIHYRLLRTALHHAGPPLRAPMPGRRVPEGPCVIALFWCWALIPVPAWVGPSRCFTGVCGHGRRG